MVFTNYWSSLIRNVNIRNCNNLYQVTTETNGYCLVFRGKCSAGHTFLWKSSDALTNQNNFRMFLDNLQLLSAIVLSGNHYQKINAC